MDVNTLKQHGRQISEKILEFLADRETSVPKKRKGKKGKRKRKGKEKEKGSNLYLNI